MSAKNATSGSARTIFRKRDGAYVAACDEGDVTRIYRFHVIKSNPREDFVAEPDRARVVLTYLAAGGLEFPDFTSVIAEQAWSLQLRPFKHTVEQ
jgi:hypothetical protein